MPWYNQGIEDIRSSIASCDNPNRSNRTFISLKKSKKKQKNKPILDGASGDGTYPARQHAAGETLAGVNFDCSSMIIEDLAH
jgi:hypothetical protein